MAGGFTGIYFGVYATGSSRAVSVPTLFDMAQQQKNRSTIQPTKLYNIGGK
ncbi:MAG: hypothetical protein K6T94_19120 [Paenibacillus sp.]|nr:hypothetical protein [Paenibacillus sp.]